MINQFLRNQLFRLRKRINEKIITIESDDWGLERALSKEALEWLGRKYGKENFSRWTTDSLETKSDLDMLFDVFRKHKKKFRYPPKITANFITHNVSYGNRNQLEFVPISEGFNSESEDVRPYYKEAINDNLMEPQIHGFSHYNLDDLEKFFATTNGLEAFKNRFFLGKTTINENLDLLHGEMFSKDLESNLKKAQIVFEKLFGFKSKTIIPPTYKCDFAAITVLKKVGFQAIQASNRLQNRNSNRLLTPYFRNFKGMKFLIRNARLDPQPSYNYYADQCLDQIDRAFKYKSPAVIDFHRVNFAGRFDQKYRQRTIKELNILFRGIYKNWPEVKFFSTTELYDYLNQRAS